MANTVLSPNMSLPVPVVGTDPGPDYAYDLNTCFSLLDSHTHSSGSGVQVTPGGLNINSDLTFLGNNATSLKSTRYAIQSSPLSGASDLGCLYVSGVDLYYNDENGNQVRITQSGAVAGTPGSIANLVSPASASFNSGTATFIFQSAANTAGNIDGGSLLVRETVAAANAVTISSPTSLSANYTLILPSALPAAQHFATIDASGNIAAPWVVDNSTLEIASSTTLQVKTSGITPTQLASNSVTTAKIADQNVTQAKLQARSTGTTVGTGGVAVSNPSGTFDTSSGSATDVTNLSVTITTTGRPVAVSVQCDPAASAGSNTGYIAGGTAAGGQSAKIFVYIRNGSTIISITQLEGVTAASALIDIPPSIYCLDFPAASTVTYKVQIAVSTGTLARVKDCILVAYEI